MSDKINDPTLENIKVLWTGGWDSTFRIVELSRKKCAVQPIYVYGDGRESEKHEIKAMKRILNDLKQKKETKANLLPINFVDKKSIPKNIEITKAFEIIAKETNLGSQHEWLARLSNIHPGLEIGTEAASLNTSNILRAIHKYGELKKNENGDGFVLDSENSTEEGKYVFGNFGFPIIHKTGTDMKNEIYKIGYEEVMKNIWVCHTPIIGKPCGMCHPCELKIETGMGFLLTKSALKRYKNRKSIFTKLKYKLLRKVSIKFL